MRRRVRRRPLRASIGAGSGRGERLRADTLRSLRTLPRYLWAVAAGLALALVALLVARLLGTPAVGWALLVAFLVVAYLRARRKATRR